MGWSFGGALDSQFWERVTFGFVRDSYFFAYRSEGGGGSLTNRLKDTDNHKFFRSTKRFLPLLFGHRFTSEQIPNHRFKFVSVSGGCRRGGSPRVPRRSTSSWLRLEWPVPGDSLSQVKRRVRYLKRSLTPTVEPVRFSGTQGDPKVLKKRTRV